MSKQYLKNIEFEKNLILADLVEYQPGQIVSRTLVQNKSVSMTLFAFAENEEISTHSSSGDAMITILEGSGKITIGENVYTVQQGETIVMPAEIPHAVEAEVKFKMLLTVIFPAQTQGV